MTLKVKKEDLDEVYETKMKKIYIIGILLTLIGSIAAMGLTEEQQLDIIKRQHLQQCVKENTEDPGTLHRYLGFRGTIRRSVSKFKAIYNQCIEEIESRHYCTIEDIEKQSKIPLKCLMYEMYVCDNNGITHMNPGCAPCRFKQIGDYYTMGQCQ